MVNFIEENVSYRSTSCTATDTRATVYVKGFVQHNTGFWSYPGHFFNAKPDRV
jgi:hypothetical protein